MKNNRDDFNQCAALVFELLYQEFPRETDVLVDELVEPLDEEMADNYFATIRFLQREGLIRYQQLDFSAFNGVVLTAKGLKVLDTIPEVILDTIPEVLKQQETMAQQISHALADNNKTAISRVIREVIKLAV
ncbi:MAG: hypothetical protein DRR08_26935 [Candidatus Parabeggiatoa sp. nov. 2]|nr:MAG: hypothetical protein DRR08_26935 [Gammaproteobacteria bacterium]